MKNNSKLNNGIIQDIINTFSTEGIPKEPISVETYDDEGTTKHFLGTNWRDYSVTELRKQYSSLVFFTPNAYRYYIPAYMLAEINDPENADIILETILSSIVDYQSSFIIQNEFLLEELLVISKFIDFCAIRYPDYDDVDFEFEVKLSDTKNIIEKSIENLQNKNQK